MMNCLCCFQCQKSSKSFANRVPGGPGPGSRELLDHEKIDQVAKESIPAHAFTFRELATATKNFRQECLLGEGGFGKVFKGTLASNGQVVAIKQLDRNGMNGNKEFLCEVLTLSLLHHPNLLNLLGYCADGDQRILVYEYMPAGSLQKHLLDMSPDQKPLDWFARMRIAFGAAKGLEYLHDQAKSPIIFRDLKPSNILLDEDYNPKISDFGLTKLGPCGDPMNVSSRVMGTYGYCSPEYARSGELTLKSDVYCFGVILLELITGRRALDTTRLMDEQNLVAWAQPIFKDPKRFPDMADPLLNKRFPEKDLNQAVAIAAMCLQEESAARPFISDVVTALSFLSVATEESLPPPLPLSTPTLEENAISDDDEQYTDHGDSSSGSEDRSSESSDDKDNSGDGETDDNSSTSDCQDHDNSDCEEGDSVDEHKQTDSETKRLSKRSTKSINTSVSGSQRSRSKRMGDRHVSLMRHKNSGVTDDRSVSSGDHSRPNSCEESPLLSRRSSKNSGLNSFLSAKSSKNSRKAFSSCASSKNSLFSLSHRSSKGSMEGSVSHSQLGSRRSQNENGSFSHSFSGETESDVSSPGSGSNSSQNGNASFDDSTSSGSHK